MKFVIDRSKWRCGYDGKFKLGEGETLLENTRGYMCCLGQIFKQLNPNLPDNLLLDTATPEDITEDSKEENLLLVKTGLYFDNSQLAIDAMDINDNDKISNEIREEKLTKLFNDHGHEIEFIN